MSIDTEFFGGQPPKWVSGTTYALDFIVRSPASQHHYVRIVAGAGATDPSADGTNWARVGAGGIKSIQRGTISFSGASQTATVSSVDTSKSRLTLLGNKNNAGNVAKVADDEVNLVLTNATTITASKTGTTNTLVVSWELEERW
jgi:hypothetical protein